MSNVVPLRAKQPVLPEATSAPEPSATVSVLLNVAQGRLMMEMLADRADQLDTAIAGAERAYKAAEDLATDPTREAKWTEAGLRSMGINARIMRTSRDDKAEIDELITIFTAAGC